MEDSNCVAGPARQGLPPWTNNPRTKLLQEGSQKGDQREGVTAQDHTASKQQRWGSTPVSSSPLPRVFWPVHPPHPVLPQLRCPKPQRPREGTSMRRALLLFTQTDPGSHRPLPAEPCLGRQPELVLWPWVWTRSASTGKRGGCRLDSQSSSLGRPGLQAQHGHSSPAATCPGQPE